MPIRLLASKMIMPADTAPIDANPQCMAPISANMLMLLSIRDLRRIDQAIAYVDAHYATHISPEGLSLEVKLSVPKLHAGLRLKTGYSLYKYQVLVRVWHAATLLEETDKSLKVIAAAVGFKTQSHFAYVFKKIKALTPSEYRNQYGR